MSEPEHQEKEKSEEAINTENQIQKYQEHITELEKIIKFISKYMITTALSIDAIPISEMLQTSLNISKDLKTVAKNVLNEVFKEKQE